MSWRPMLAASILTAMCLSTAIGRETDPKAAKPAPRSQDAVLFDTLKKVINKGVDLYNHDDPGACYRLYQGSLLTLEPMLAHHPELQKTIQKALDAASRDPIMWRRAFTLRGALDKVRKELNPNKDKDKEKAKEKLPPPSVDDKKEGEKKDADKQDPVKKDSEKSDADKPTLEKKDPEKKDPEKKDG